MYDAIKKLFAGSRVKDFIYPAISLVLFAIAIIFFVWTARFLYERIDRALSLAEDDASSAILRLDWDNFHIVATKLHVPIRDEDAAPTETLPASVTEPEPSAATSETTVATPASEPAPEPTVIDPKSLKVAVYNSTETSGLAGKLKTALENGGFVVSETGNKTPPRETTVVAMKESLSGSAARETLLSIITQSYTTTLEILPANDSFDIIIIIGSK